MTVTASSGKSLRQRVKHWMWIRIQQDDDIGMTCTELAEEAAIYFDHDKWLDDETHWIWELAFEVVEDAERIGLRPKFY